MATSGASSADPCGDPSPSKKKKVDLIFVVDTKVQKKRYEIMLKKCKEKGINVTSTFSTGVTHIATECSTLEELCKQKQLSAGIFSHDLIQAVKISWLSECLREGHVVSVKECHRLPQLKEETKVSSSPTFTMPEYACQRATPLRHNNERFTKTLRILEKEADLKGDEENDRRALAFRRGMTTLASLPRPVGSAREIAGLPHIGKHIEKVVQEMLETGSCQEVEDIENSEWFQVNQGVGPATSQTWYKLGLRTIRDAINHPTVQATKDLRVAYGLAFYEDLALPVLRSEADWWQQLVQSEASQLLPGATVTLTGGFSRGKLEGHDIDLLISHPLQGEEAGLLPRLLDCLEAQGLIVYGRWEQNSFQEKVLRAGNKGVQSRSTLDYFEKWLGIVKIDKRYRTHRAVQDSVARVTHEIEPKTSFQEAQGHGQGQSKLDSLEAETYKPKLQRQCSLSKALEESQSPRDWHARRVDLIVVPQDQYYYALIGWIGSRMFNRSIRHYADKVMNMKLTSHGLYDHRKHQSLPARSQKDVFDHLKLPYREPFERNC